MERFDVYMERCLYGPDGFYTTHGVAGRSKGDFITSPEVGPLFGAVVANALDACWEAAARPDHWTVYDVGCGPNTLLKAVRRARPVDRRPWRLVGVDRAALGAADGPTSGQATIDDGPPMHVGRATELPDDLTNCVVIANELLDNLPFRIVEHGPDGTWVEVHVDNGTERRVPTDLRLDIPPGTRAPVLEQAQRWCRSVLDRQPDHVIAFDYGVMTTPELARRGGWLRTYRRHERGHDPFRDPGRWDITTDVAVDQLPTGAAVSTQTEYLERWGISGLVAEGREYWKAHAARPDTAAIEMRSRVSEAEALTDPGGLGSWLVVEYPAS